MVAKAKPAAKTAKERPAARAAAKAVKVTKPKKPAFDYTSLYGESMDTIARRQNAEPSTLDSTQALSTGLLMMDLQLGGGIRGAWYTTFGGEQSCKTTSALTIMASAIKAGVPLLEWWDYEGSTANSRPYVASIVKGSGVKLTVDEVFGKRDEKTGKWIIRPRVRYHSESIGEKFFDYLSEVLRTLPDKRCINKEWWLVFEDNKVNKAKYSEVADASMAKKYGNGIWVPAPDGNLQAVFFLDSYPAMNSVSQDTEDTSNKLAIQASMFSKHIPRVKGRLTSKMVAVVGVNQLRDVPMAMYGPKEREPGGQALRYYSDARIKNTSRGSGYPLWAKTFNKEYFEVEKSVNVEGVDLYRYIHAKAIKNKLGTPQRQAWYRLWHEDAAGDARGFDPFFDTMLYLRITGQILGKGRKGLTLNIEGLGKTKPLDWLQYKAWIMGTKEEMIAVSKKAGVKPMSLRAYCFKQLQGGVGETLYVKQKGEKVEEESDE